MEVNHVLNKVIILGLIAAVLSQYAWLLPIRYAELFFSLVALVCAVIAVIWTLFERVTR